MTELAQLERNAERIMVVDGARRSRRRVALQLTQAGYTVVTAESADQAVDMIRHHGAPRLAIIDTTLPNLQGMDLAKSLQSQGASPVLLLCTPYNFASCPDAPVLSSPAEGHKDCAEALLLRPYVPAVLLNAVQCLIRSTEAPVITDTETTIDANLSINFAQRYVLRDGERIRLTPTESRLVHLLYMNRGRAVSPNQLVSAIWNGKRTGTLGSLWVHVRRLRNKLERDPEKPEVLVTIRGHGYALRQTPYNLN